MAGAVSITGKTMYPVVAIVATLLLIGISHGSYVRWLGGG
jgi:hypothetical protein